MAGILSIVSTVSFVLAGIFLIIAILLWIKFGILNIIGDLSGRTAKKSIAKMRENNEKIGKKSFKPSFVNLGRGKLTDAMKGSEKLNKSDLKDYEYQPETGILEKNEINGLCGIMTDILEDNNLTGLLNEKETEILNNTTTTLLNEDIEDHLEKVTGIVDFKIIDEVIIVHTDEFIS
ncbi:hypothetical protein E5347_16175 [Clostridium sartagoforme]|uniref:Uncharacterized protein n=1 Tax=Clostridium sartagoforme TaxID=84031 RepID=A0A4S2DE52_9CLOT|nr:hypothetical protein [Clostridium sartagoforme]TGY39935.1 hypothetical protein E5347_16175 [Clostridium sartagoforme]